MPAGMAARAHQMENAQVLEAEDVARRHGPGFLILPFAYRTEQNMNTSTAENPVNGCSSTSTPSLRSCEQENRALRGKPVIVVQTLTDSAVAIAASYAAKAFGIKTGTLMRDARQLCPSVIAPRRRRAPPAVLMVRILSPPAKSLRTFGSSRTTFLSKRPI